MRARARAQLGETRSLALATSSNKPNQNKNPPHGSYDRVGASHFSASSTGIFLRSA